MLSGDDIRRALLALAGELDALSVRCEIVVVGGAAVVLLYGAREATKDVDVLFLGNTEPTIVHRAIHRAGNALGLPDDWLNDAAKGYVHGLSLGEILLDVPALLVRALAPQQLLAMKLSAWRDDVDIEDARLLLGKLSADRDEVWGLVERTSSRGGKPKRTSRSVISGRPSMELSELVRALLSYDALTARQWVADSIRQGVVWALLPQPTELDAIGMGVAAGIAELLAARAGQDPPLWVGTVEVAPTRVYLVKAARTMPRLRELCEREGPELLRRRGILAPPEFLTVA